MNYYNAVWYGFSDNCNGRRKADALRGPVVSVDTGIIRTLCSITLEVLPKL